MNNNRNNEEGDKHMNTDKYVGLDVHKDTTVVAIAAGGRDGDPSMWTGTGASVTGGAAPR